MLQSFYHNRESDGASIVFRSKGFSPDWQLASQYRKPMAMESLPPFLRTLLVTDGTVTKSLEAFYWEPVVIEGVRNTVIEAESDIGWLDVSAGEKVVARSVLLRGGRSGALYASAFSIIRHSLIPESLRKNLLAGSLGIGELIRECGLETYREIQEFGHATDMSAYGGPQTDVECVYRTYRIILDHRPAILVSECFPVAAFSQGQHQS